MQKNNNYTFLLSKTTDTKIFIRRIEISKKMLHGSVAGLVLMLGITFFGFSDLIENDNIAQAKNTYPVQTVSKVRQNTVPHYNLQNTQAENLDAINYSRPEASDEFSINSGGPSNPFMLSSVETDKEETALEKKLRRIEATTNPAFLPTMWAHLGGINNEYGFRRNPFGGRSYEFHGGMDIDGERGDIVVAPANGVVTKAGWQGGYGNLIELNHGNGLTTRYGHLSRIQINLGETVQRGELIGLIGSTGRSTGPHLHYELRLDDKSINPRRFLPPEPGQIRAIRNY